MLVSAATVQAPSSVGRRLSGSANVGLAEREDQPLEVNLLHLEDERGRSALLVSFDLLFVGCVLKAKLREAFPETTVLAFATHTHSAPSTDPRKPRLGAFDPEWTQALAERVIAAAARLRDGQGFEATASVSSGAVGCSMNRRRAWPWPVVSRRGLERRGIAMAPNPAGPAADCARVAVLRKRQDEAPIAIISSWACHPTSNIDRSIATSDYVGPLRSAFRARLGDAPILHLQGFAGDVRPPGGRAPPYAPLRTLVRGPRFYPFTPAGLAAWEEAVSTRITDLVGCGEPLPLCGDLDFGSTQIDLRAFLEGAPDRSLEVGRIRVGNAFALTYLEAEPSAEHAGRVASIFPADWPVGYAGDVFGYLPTDSQVPRGGYEVHGYMPRFGMSGRYRGSIDEALCAALERLSGE
jgi:hypothetical protein